MGKEEEPGKKAGKKWPEKREENQEPESLRDQKVFKEGQVGQSCQICSGARRVGEGGERGGGEAGTGQERWRKRTGGHGRPDGWRVGRL